MDPGPTVRSRLGIEAVTELNHIFAHLGHEKAARVAGPTTGTVYTRWTDYGCLELFAMRNCRCLHDLVSWPVQVVVGQTGNLVYVGYVGPDLRVELAVVGIRLPVGNDTSAREPDQEAGSRSAAAPAQEACNLGFEAGDVLWLAAV